MILNDNYVLLINDNVGSAETLTITHVSHFIVIMMLIARKGMIVVYAGINDNVEYAKMYDNCICGN